MHTRTVSDGHGPSRFARARGDLLSVVPAPSVLVMVGIPLRRGHDLGRVIVRFDDNFVVSTVKVIDDDAVGGDIRLATRSGQLMFVRGRGLYSLSMA